MHLSEVLERVSKKYVLGATEFYSKMNPDPWQQAHDELEGQLLLHGGATDYFEKMKPANKKFLSEIEKLIKAYKAVSKEIPTTPSISDCLMIGNENRVKNMYSLANNECVSCGSKEKIRASNHKDFGHSILCFVCAP